ncbi:hypothetical protein [Nitratireductor thuwali]|uniref:DUF3052 domain-containing protein n=1 Tax=Nitratireductor thuwali TaxID=2267699 RepID=A0ABY5MIK2_9HYPH|nr:hypothetical protein NTH_02301 [Nitratireductor thuwali]
MKQISPHRTVAQKMGVKTGGRAYFVNAASDVLAAMSLPPLEIVNTARGLFDHIHVFVANQAELDAEFSKLKPHLGERGALWVSWPKSGKLGTDLKLPEVIRIGYSHGLVESKTLSVNDIWAAMKFTHPKAGKTYSNSYGSLPPDQ